MSEPEPRPAGPADGDLVAAVAAVLRACRADPAAVTRAARAQGVGPETVEAVLVASAVTEWLARLPGPGDRAAAAETGRAEATRAVFAMGAGRPVTLALRAEPLLALRLVELADLSQRTPERTALDLIAGAVDPAYTDLCRRAGFSTPRPWHGRTTE